MLLQEKLITISNNICKSLNLSGPNIFPLWNRDKVYYPHKNHYSDEKHFLHLIPLSSENFTLEKLKSLMDTWAWCKLSNMLFQHRRHETYVNVGHKL